MKKLAIHIKKINAVTAVFYIFVFFLLLNNSFDYIDPDLGWHLKVGEQISLDKKIPSAETYDYTLEKTTWVDHEWLINLISYQIYNRFGYIALSAFFSLLIIILLILQKKLIKNYIVTDGKGGIAIIIMQLFGVYASLPHLGIRMQELPLVYITLLFLIIYKYNKNQKISCLFWLLPLFLAWASTHASFLIGLFILGFWFFCKFIENILSKREKFNFLDFNNKITAKKSLIFLFFCFLAFIATLLTPYKTELYHFLTAYANDAYMTKIIEWQPFYYLPINYFQLLFCSIIIAFIFISFANAVKNSNSKKINIWELSISAFFVFMALKSKRHFPLLFVVSFPFLIDFFYNYLALPAKKFQKNINFNMVSFFFYAAGTCAAALLVIDTKFTDNPFQSYKNKMPVEAVNFLKNAPRYADKKLLSGYGWGGYLIWEWPEKKLFIDGRLPIAPFAGHTLLDEYLEFFNKDKTGDKLSEYGIELILMPHRKHENIKLNWFEKYFLLINEEKVNKKTNKLFDYLNANGADWKLVREDEASLIYEKINK